MSSSLNLVLSLQSLDHVTWQVGLNSKYVSCQVWLKEILHESFPRKFKGIQSPKPFNIDQHFSNCNVGKMWQEVSILPHAKIISFDTMSSASAYPIGKVYNVTCFIQHLCSITHMCPWQYIEADSYTPTLFLVLWLARDWIRGVYWKCLMHYAYFAQTAQCAFSAWTRAWTSHRLIHCFRWVILF